ncbi:MAG TPA: hypothetical protein VEC60_09235 [Reyranella sp.]|nr:hypothetical protein [Reyranella sp.]
MTPARAAMLHDAVDRQAAERFSILPTVAPYGAAHAGGPWEDVNARRLVDPERSGMDFTGTWVAPRVPAERRPGLARDSGAGGARREISAGRPCVKYSDGALPWRPQIGHQVTRLSTGERFEVAEIAGDGYGRTILLLTATAAA